MNEETFKDWLHNFNSLETSIENIEESNLTEDSRKLIKSAYNKLYELYDIIDKIEEFEGLNI